MGDSGIMSGGSLTITVNIDLDKYVKNMDELEKLYPYIMRGFQDGVSEFALRLKAKLVENLTKYGLGNSTLMTSLKVFETAKGITIEVDSDHAEFVEYGTGIVGSTNPHPHPWAYDVHNHGDDGWVYIGEDGKTHWTKGMPSRPFVYDTWLWGTRSVSNIVNKNIRRELKKIKGMKG